MLEALGLAMAHVATVIVILLAAPVVYEAIARDAGHPTIWAFEVTLYAFVTGAFLANAYALKRGNHFRVTILMKLFPRLENALNKFSLAATALFGLVMIVAGSMFVHYSFTFGLQSSTLLSVPLYLPQLTIPLGGLALMCQAIAMLILGETPDESADFG